MQPVQYVKNSSLLLFSILPVSLVGYFFAVSYEDLFFLYEWILVVILVGAGGLALTGALTEAGKLRWILLSIFLFSIHFSVLGLFLGPFTMYSMFIIYYVITFFAFLTYITAFLASDRFRFIPFILMIVSVLLTIYVIILNGLWGKDLT
jgi:hypothetical protein